MTTFDAFPVCVELELGLPFWKLVIITHLCKVHFNLESPSAKSDRKPPKRDGPSRLQPGQCHGCSESLYEEVLAFGKLTEG